MKKRTFVVVLLCLLLAAVLFACNAEEGLPVGSIENAARVYAQGSDFSIEGAILVLTMPNGEIKRVEISDDMLLSSPDMNTSGKKRIEVAYAGATYSFEIEVTARPDETTADGSELSDQERDLPSESDLLGENEPREGIDPLGGDPANPTSSLQEQTSEDSQEQTSEDSQEQTTADSEEQTSKDPKGESDDQASVPSDQETARAKVVSYAFEGLRVPAQTDDVFSYGGFLLHLTYDDQRALTLTEADVEIVEVPDLMKAGEKVFRVRYGGEDFSYSFSFILDPLSSLDKEIRAYLGSGKAETTAHDLSIRAFLDGSVKGSKIDVSICETLLDEIFPESDKPLIFSMEQAAIRALLYVCLCGEKKEQEGRVVGMPTESDAFISLRDACFDSWYRADFLQDESLGARLTALIEALLRTYEREKTSLEDALAPEAFADLNALIQALSVEKDRISDVEVVRENILRTIDRLSESDDFSPAEKRLIAWCRLIVSDVPVSEKKEGTEAFVRSDVAPRFARELCENGVIEEAREGEVAEIASGFLIACLSDDWDSENLQKLLELTAIDWSDGTKQGSALIGLIAAIFVDTVLDRPVDYNALLKLLPTPSGVKKIDYNKLIGRALEGKDPSELFFVDEPFVTYERGADGALERAVLTERLGVTFGENVLGIAINAVLTIEISIGL